MSFLLKTGQELELESGKRLLIQRFIGKGGQGEVYEVNEPPRLYRRLFI